jgi:uncharacterized protein with GYD domain
MRLPLPGGSGEWERQLIMPRRMAKAAAAPYHSGVPRDGRWPHRRRSQGEPAMATYIVLGNFTEQGIRNVRGSPDRTAVVRDMAKKSGVTLKETYWTLGSYDIVAIFESPDEASMTALGLSIGIAGNVRTQTLRAFTHDEMKGIIGKIV